MVSHSSPFGSLNGLLELFCSIMLLLDFFKNEDFDEDDRILGRRALLLELSPGLVNVVIV